MDHLINSTKRMQLPIDSKVYDLFHFHVTLLEYLYQVSSNYSFLPSQNLLYYLYHTIF